MLSGAVCPQALVTPAWLTKHLDQVSILDVTPAGFAKARIPGAQMLPVQAVLSGSRADLIAALRQAGVRAEGKIVIYQNDGWPVPMARAFAALDAAGLGERVSVLDGGINAWLDAGGALERGPTWARAIGDISLGRRASPHAFVDRAYVAARLGQPHTLLLDARIPALYSGKVVERPGERAGHVPGAVNLPFTDLSRPDAKFLPLPALAARFRAAGMRPGDEVIVYCHSGLKAGVVYFAARLLGYKVRLYSGSWLDWTSARP